MPGQDSVYPYDRTSRPTLSGKVRRRPPLWLSTWLSSPRKVAGMDGNRTHPGRLSSAPQTVLKTAGLTSGPVHKRSLQFMRKRLHSTIVGSGPPMSAGLAVYLAVSDPSRRFAYRTGLGIAT